MYSIKYLIPSFEIIVVIIHVVDAMSSVSWLGLTLVIKLLYFLQFLMLSQDVEYGIHSLHDDLWSSQGLNLAQLW